MRATFCAVIAICFVLTGCAVQTNQGMTMTQLNNAVGLSGNGNLVLVSRAGDYEIYQSSAVINWKSQIAQGNQIAKSILTPEKNVYYIIKGGALQQEIIGDQNINAFISKNQPPVKAAPPVAKSSQSTNARGQQAQRVPLVNLIDTTNRATFIGSCAGISYALKVATNNISIGIRQRPTQNQDDFWRLNKEAESIDKLGDLGDLYTKIDYGSVPPSQVGDINTALMTAQGKAMELAQTTEGSWQVINAFNKCRGR